MATGSWTTGAGAACADAGKEHLPSSWRDAVISCRQAGDVWKADVTAQVPLFFPGFDTGWRVEAAAGAAAEGDVK